MWRNETLYHGLIRVHARHIDLMEAFAKDDVSIIGNYVPAENAPRCPKCDSYRYAVCDEKSCDYQVCTECGFSPNPERRSYEHS
jgi:hypothetical protein